MPDRPAAIARGVWATIENQRPFTFDQIQFIAGIRPEEAAQYVGLLERVGYVGISGIRRADSGEEIPVFRLYRRTGPVAPRVDDEGNFVDPNVRTTGGLKGRHRRKGELAARLRIAEERIGRPFTSEELAAAIGVSRAEKRSFQATLYRLRQSGEITRLEDGRFEFHADPGRKAERIRQFLKTCVGRTVTLKEIRKAVGRAVAGSDIRLARERLEAEGFTVTFLQRGTPSLQLYLIEGSREMENGEPAKENWRMVSDES